MKLGIVKVTHVEDQWIVSVRDQSIVHEKAFLVEQHAMSWAMGQAARLDVRVDMVEQRENSEQ